MSADEKELQVVELKLPELGENIESVDVSAVLVAVGDLVRRDQPVIEVETEKASLEVPSVIEGRIKQLMVSKGDKVAVGQVLLVVEGIPGESGAEAEVEADRVSPPEATAPTMAPEPAAAGLRPPEIGPTVPASPSVRALARELGVAVAEVAGSGRAGRITREDVKAHAKRLITGRAPAQAGAAVAAPLPDFSVWGPVRREPMSNIRRATAASMARAWTSVPHVSQFDRADITELESMRKNFNARPEAEGRKLTVTAMVIKAVAAALRRFPEFNASLDTAGDAVVFKDYVHIGVAVDTERGLLVPVIRDVDRKPLFDVVTELNDLAARARAKKIKPDEMQGGTFTVSNLGGLGTTYFSPIVNWPQAAILGVGRAEFKPVMDEGQFRPRLLLPLSVSYDHRLIDGANAARFARWIAEALEQPLLFLLGGGEDSTPEAGER